MGNGIRTLRHAGRPHTVTYGILFVFAIVLVHSTGITPMVMMVLASLAFVATVALVIHLDGTNYVAPFKNGMSNSSEDDDD